MVRRLLDRLNGNKTLWGGLSAAAIFALLALDWYRGVNIVVADVPIIKTTILNKHELDTQRWDEQHRTNAAVVGSLKIIDDKITELRNRLPPKP